MIVSFGRRYVFVHAPKTGGTSLALALEARAMKDDLLIGDTPKSRNRHKRQKAIQGVADLSKHSALRDLETALSPGRIAPLFVFMTVRNPWDRMVSFYHWARAQSFDHPSIEVAKSSTFAEFLKHSDTRTRFSNSPYQAYVQSLSGDAHCDAFVRLEHLAKDLLPVEAHLGFALDIGHSNQSQREQDYRVYYSTETADLVAEICASDIETFDYSFE